METQEGMHEANCANLRLMLASAALLSGVALGSASAQDKELTLCWAAWDPANALVELSKDFTAETGINMKFEFVPWTSYADRFLNELNSQGTLCDLIIGDSQWIGGSAENGHYVKLNDFFDKEGISMDDFLRATVYAYSTWPKGTPNYWALPAMGDALGWTYRKDWFEKPELQAEFKEKYGRDLAPPKTWTELKEIAEFFQGREIDGKTVYGAAIFTERGSEGITMGVTAALYSWGFKYERPRQAYEMEGVVNSPDAVAALEFYKELYKCCTPPGYSDAYMQEGLDAFKSGQVAMHDELVRLLAGHVQGRECRRRQDRLLRQSRREGRRLARSAARASRSSPTPTSRTTRSTTSSGSRSPRCRRSGGARRLLDRQVGARSIRASRQSAPYRGRLPRSPWARCRTSGRSRPSPSCMQAMQKRVHDYVVADQGTAQGSARQADRGLDRDLRGRRQDLSRRSGKRLLPARPGSAGSTGLPESRSDATGSAVPASETSLKGMSETSQTGNERHGSQADARGRDAGATPLAGRAALRGSPTGRSPGCSSRRRSCCSSRSTSFR